MAKDVDERSDEEIQEEWDAFVPDLLEGIEQGWMDKHLKQLAQALFKRRDELFPEVAKKAQQKESKSPINHDDVVEDTGNDGARNSDGDPDPDPSKAHGGTTTSNAAPKRVGNKKHSTFGSSRKIRADFDKPAQMLRGKVRPVATPNDVRDSDDRTWTVKDTGKHYRRKDLVGKSFRLPAISTAPGLKGCLVQVVGVGPQNIMVGFREDPMKGSPTPPEGYGYAYDKNEAKYFRWTEVGSEVLA